MPRVWDDADRRGRRFRVQDLRTLLPPEPGRVTVRPDAAAGDEPNGARPRRCRVTTPTEQSTRGVERTYTDKTQIIGIAYAEGPVSAWLITSREPIHNVRVEGTLANYDCTHCCESRA